MPGLTSDPDSAEGLAQDRASALMIRVAEGDLDAFGELYDELAPVVFAMVQRVVRNREIAEEVTQDVFLWVWRRARSFDPACGSAWGLIRTVARCRAVDAVRREALVRHKAVLLRAEGERRLDPVLTPSAQLEQRELVETCMADLSERQRAAIRLAYWEGLTGPELAERLGVGLAAAKARKQDALVRMRAVARLAGAAQ